MKNGMKKIICWMSAFLICWAPLTVSFAAVDCLFHADPVTHQYISESHHDEFADVFLDEPQHHDHSSHQHDMNDNTADNGCATSLIAAAIVNVVVNPVRQIPAGYLDLPLNQKLTAPTIPLEIRPPIHA